MNSLLEKHYWFEPLHGSICRRSARAMHLFLCVYVVWECICMYTVKFIVSECCACILVFVCVTKGSMSVCVCVSLCVCACVCVCVGGCGWAGWGRRPWCGRLCVTSTHGDGGMRLHASPRMSGNPVDECICACVCMCVYSGPTWPYRSLCICVSWRRLGNICCDTRNSCPTNPRRYTAITINLPGSVCVSLHSYGFLLLCSCVCQMFFKWKFYELFLMTACVGKVSVNIKCNTIKTHSNSTTHKCNICTWISFMYIYVKKKTYEPY